MQFPLSTHFIRAQLVKVQRNFFHPNVSKLLNFIKRAWPEHATKEMRSILDDITKRYDPFQSIKPGPHRFRVTIGTENLRFNERVMMDIMYLSSSPVLKIVDEGTHFSAACFLKKLSIESVWEGFIRCWSFIYTGLRNRILIDQGSSFWKRFNHLAKAAIVEVDCTGIEANSILGLAERYHGPLRNIYRKLRIFRQNVNAEKALACAAKAMNDTLGPEGLVPSALIFGEFPRVFNPSESNTTRLTNNERAELDQVARQEMEQQMVSLILKLALHHAVSPSSDRVYEPGYKVLVWREKMVNNIFTKWLGLFLIYSMNREKKLLYVQDTQIHLSNPLAWYNSNRIIL